MSNLDVGVIVREALRAQDEDGEFRIGRIGEQASIMVEWAVKTFLGRVGRHAVDVARARNPLSVIVEEGDIDSMRTQPSGTNRRLAFREDLSYPSEIRSMRGVGPEGYFEEGVRFGDGCAPGASLVCFAFDLLSDILAHARRVRASGLFPEGELTVWEVADFYNEEADRSFWQPNCESLKKLSRLLGPKDAAAPRLNEEECYLELDRVREARKVACMTGRVHSNHTLQGSVEPSAKNARSSSKGQMQARKKSTKGKGKSKSKKGKGKSKSKKGKSKSKKDKSKKGKGKGKGKGKSKSKKGAKGQASAKSTGKGKAKSSAKSPKNRKGK
jgi:cobalamin biosynthesis Mg chelatase CobN